MGVFISVVFNIYSQVQQPVGLLYREIKRAHKVSESHTTSFKVVRISFLPPLIII